MTIDSFVGNSNFCEFHILVLIFVLGHSKEQSQNNLVTTFAFSYGSLTLALLHFIFF